MVVVYASGSEAVLCDAPLVCVASGGLPSAAVTMLDVPHIRE
jgi:hypothetical protein